MKPKDHDERMDLQTLDLPAWVHWLAQDADGRWWGYEVEPHQHHQGWYENELGRNINTNKVSPSHNWKHSLLRWVKNK